MRRIQLYLDDDLDHALSTEAAKTGRSRSALMREAVSAWLGDRATSASDPIDELIGSIDIDPVEDIDAVLYDG